MEYILDEAFNLLNRRDKLYRLEEYFYDMATKKDASKMYDILILMSKYVTKDHARGAINPDFLQIHQTDLLCVACIVAGYRKVAYWVEFEEFSPIFQKVLTMHQLYYITVRDANSRPAYVIYSSRGRHSANKLVAFLSLKNRTNEETNRVFGECLGYPQQDIEYFLKYSKSDFLRKERINRLKEIL